MIGVEYPKRLATLLELLQVDGDRVTRGGSDVGDVELFQARTVGLENKNTYMDIVEMENGECKIMNPSPSQTVLDA